MLKRRIQWVFLDMGTTLIDETRAHRHRIRDMLAGTGISFEQFHEKRIAFARQNLNGDAEAIRFFGLTKTPWPKEDEVPYPQAEAILAYLRDRGYGIGVIANQSPGSVERLRGWGLLSYIDVVAASAELGVAKPDRAIFDRALEMAHCTAQEAVMIGDRLDNDVVPAKRLGMATVWIRQGLAVYQAPRCAEERADAVVRHLLELKEIL